MGTILDVLNDPVRGQQLVDAVQKTVTSLLMAPGGVTVDTNRFANYKKIHFVNFPASDLVWWGFDEGRIPAFTGHWADIVLQDLKTSRISAVGSINVQIVPNLAKMQHAITVTVTY